MNSNKYKDSYYENRPIKDLREMIDGACEIFSGKPAFLVKDEHGKPYRPISFAQFGLEIHALGTAFVDMGLKGKKIAVIGENSYEWVVSYFATTNGTGVVVPLDRELKPEEIANLLNRAEVSALVFSDKLADVVEKVEAMLDKPLAYNINMNLEDDTDKALSWSKLILRGRKLLEEGNRDFLDAEIDPNEMSSLLFTSGTTGMAKGVMLSHANIAANVYNMSKYVKVDNYVGLSVLPMHHTYEMTCHVCTGLYQGFTLAICEGLKHIIPNMQESKTTVMLAVPLIYETIHKKIMKNAQKQGKLEKLQKAIKISRKLKLYNHPAVVKKMFKDVHEITGGHIQLFIAGGAAIDPQVIEDFEAMGFPMIQGYGMTENAPIIAVNRDRCSKAAAAGFPMPKTDIKIVDPDEDGIGEIYCKGPSVMLGYYDSPEESEKAFDNGWLKTGDYGYFDNEGYVYVTGRKKNVIVSKNGKNIFPEEIEYYLLLSDYIEEVLVHGIEDERTGDIVVKAEIFPNMTEVIDAMGRPPEEEELKNFLKAEVEKANEKMPVYKRVKRIGIRKEEFAKTTTRKIKRYNEDNMSSEEA